MRKRNAGKLSCGRRTASGIALTERLIESLADSCAVGRKNTRRFRNYGGKLFLLHKAELRNHLCSFINHYPEKPSSRIADDRRKSRAVGKCRRAWQTAHNRFLRQFLALRPYSKRQTLRERKCASNPCKRTRACPYHNAFKIGEPEAMLRKEIAHLHGPICATGIRPFENPLENATIRRQGNGLRVCGTVYGKQVHRSAQVVDSLAFI